MREFLTSRIQSYRTSRLHERSRGCCRFTPTCSHYGEQVLQRHSVPFALLLIAWRLLRCNPLLTPRRGRQKVLAVLALSGMTTLFVAATASAATAFQGGGGSGTAGGCDVFVGGAPVNSLDSNHPLQVHKGQRVLLTGQAPLGIRNLPSSLGLRSSTDIKIHFIEKLATRTETHRATGQNFQRSVNVDNYLKYGSGVYRVDVHSVAPGGWDCSTTFYVEMHGSKLAAEVAVAVGGIGAAGMAASARGDEPSAEDLPPKEDSQGLVDPGTTAEAYDKQQVRKDKSRTRTADGVGCLAGILFALIASTGAFAMAVPVPKGSARTIWVKGHPILGFISGVVAGLGATVAMQQFGRYPLNVTTAIVMPLVIGVIGGLRGWRGTAWKIG